MANNNLFLLRQIRSLGIGAFACTPTELAVLQKAGFCGKEIVFAGSNLSDEEIAIIAKAGVFVNADSVTQIEAFARLAGASVHGIRVTPELMVRSRILNSSIGEHCRMGILESDIPMAIESARTNGVILRGTHMYVGTSIDDYSEFKEPLDRLVHVSRNLKSLEYVDIGGGFGVPINPDQKEFDWKSFGAFLSAKMSELSGSLDKTIELKLEPGRAIIASAGVLLTRVTEVKRSKDRVFVGTDTSLSNFIRPYLYHQSHSIELAASSLSRKTEENVFLCGNTAASNDILAQYSNYPFAEKGDILAIRSVGAYGMSMSSHFCGRLRPAEVAIDGNTVTLIRKRELEDDFLSGQLW
jgi:diaminopimelate decarboxylase